MTQKFFQFGELLPDYSIPVLNERAVRAGAGILFFFSIVTFMNAFLVGNFLPTRVFVVAFLVDFTIRIFINPRYAPSLILGHWAVRKQRPDYVGAPQKRFAWGIGFLLALLMFYLMVLNSVIGPINMIVCSVCMLLLFFEASFGICIGCKVYNAFNKEKAQLCPGGVCDLPGSEVPDIRMSQVLIVVAFLVVVSAIGRWVYRAAPAVAQQPEITTNVSPSTPTNPAEAARCQVPAFAKAMGHEEKWKLHNNCQ
ncbi:MAG: DUF4395 domain-containing protein [Burkholderiales bacterium]